MRAERHPDEPERLAALRSYEILDTPAEAAFDDLASLAARVCAAPVALITFIDGDRQWFKARVGVDVREVPFEASLCAHMLREGGGFEVPDLARDPRFADNPFVTGERAMRFYAGTTLETVDGLPLGTLCVLDTRPRELDDLQRETLRILGRQAMAEIESRRRLVESEAKRREIQETLVQAEIATWVRTRNPDLVRPNGLFRRLFGLPPDETGAVPLVDVMRAIHPDDRENVRRAAAEAVANRSLYEAEYRVVGRDGRERWVLARGQVVEGTDALTGIVMDVSARKAAEEALLAERAQFRRLLDAAPAHIVTLTGPELRYEFANQAFLEFVGQTDFLGLPAQDAWPVPPEHIAMLQGILATGEPVLGAAEPVRTPGGGLGYYDFMFQPLRDAEGAVSGVFVHSIDVTEKVVAREALRQTEERFRAAQETTPDAFAIVDCVRDEASAIVDFAWVYVNPAAERLTRQSKEALIGARIMGPQPGGLARGLFAPFVRVVETGEPFSQEMPLGGSSPRTYFRVTAVRVGDGVAVSFSDVTDRMRVQQDLQEMVAERTQELREAVEEAERFNYSVSHDLRTPLRAISMTSHILLEEAGSDLTAPHRDLLERQAHNARRLGGLIDGLLRLSRLGRVAMTPTRLDLTALACAVADEITCAQEHPCLIEVQSGLTAEGDAHLVRLVLANLMENACKFSHGRGVVRVGRRGDAFFVSDEGVGFDMKHAAKLFEPFERLVHDDEFPGTGIGLANVERIVRRHGGHVWAESAPGNGATFYFTLG